MKIIQVIPTLSAAGGAERFVVDLSISLQKLGNNVLIIVLYKDTYNFFQQEIEANRLRVVYLDKKKGFDYSNSKLLRKTILNFSPDIVHTHINCHLSMKLSGLWLKRNKIKFFHTIHNVPSQECPRPILYAIMKNMYRKRIVVPITISDSLAYETQKYYKLNFTPTAIYNGVFVDKFNYSKPVVERKYTFISIASFQPKKNQIMIARASVALIAKGYNVRTVFLGKGKEMENVKKFVTESGCSRYITFEGQVKNVNDFLEDSKCFVLPSWFEGNPISILEAMASGTAIIASNVGGAKDVVEEDNGYLVNPFNLDELILLMEKVLIDENTLIKFSVNNVKKILQYDMLKVAISYINAYGLIK